MAEWPCCHDPLRFSPLSLRFVPPPLPPLHPLGGAARGFRSPLPLPASSQGRPCCCRWLAPRSPSLVPMRLPASGQGSALLLPGTTKPELGAAAAASQQPRVGLAAADAWHTPRAWCRCRSLPAAKGRPWCCCCCLPAAKVGLAAAAAAWHHTARAWCRWKVGLAAAAAWQAARAWCRCRCLPAAKGRLCCCLAPHSPSLAPLLLPASSQGSVLRLLMPGKIGRAHV